MFKVQRLASSGENGLKIRTQTGHKIGQDQASSVGLLHLLQIVIEISRNFVIRTKAVIRSSSVTRSQFS